jgi:hypothetical protein
MSPFNSQFSVIHVASVMDPQGLILGFLVRSRYYRFQVDPRLYSGGWVDPIPDPLLHRKSGSAWNRTRDLRICSQELWPLDHRGGNFLPLNKGEVICKCNNRNSEIKRTERNMGRKRLVAHYIALRIGTSWFFIVPKAHSAAAKEQIISHS